MRMPRSMPCYACHGFVRQCSRGLKRICAGPVTQHFWKCLPGEDPQSRQIKSIVSTKLVKGVGPDPHTFLYQPGYSAVSMSGEPIESFMSNNFEEDSLVLLPGIPQFDVAEIALPALVAGPLPDRFAAVLANVTDTAENVPFDAGSLSLRNEV